MLRAIGLLLFIALLLISPFCWATITFSFRGPLRRRRGCSSRALTAQASEPLHRRESVGCNSIRMQMLRSQPRALCASCIRSIRSAGGSYLAWASGTTAME